MNRDFKGIWIPRELWECSDLSWTEKLLMLEVDSLDYNGDGCYASNEYLAKWLGVSKDRVRKIIYKLVDMGYLKSTLIYKQGTHEVDKRILKPTDLWAETTRPYGRKQPDPMGENDHTPLGENDHTPWAKTTTIEKKKENNNLLDNKRESISPSAVVDLYHQLCPSYSRIVKITDSRAKAIKARLNDYTLEQIRSAFRMAEESSFLKGKNEREWKATFDWLMKPGSIAKILEGNYRDNDKTKTNRIKNIDEEETL